MIERVFADAKEKHAMRYTHHRGLAAVIRWVKLKYATMNLKNLAIWSGNHSVFLLFQRLYLSNTTKPLLLPKQKQGFFDKLKGQVHEHVPDLWTGNKKRSRVWNTKQEHSCNTVHIHNDRECGYPRCAAVFQQKEIEHDGHNGHGNTAKKLAGTVGKNTEEKGALDFPFDIIQIHPFFAEHQKRDDRAEHHRKATGESRRPDSLTKEHDEDHVKNDIEGLGGNAQPHRYLFFAANPKIIVGCVVDQH